MTQYLYVSTVQRRMFLDNNSSTTSKPEPINQPADGREWELIGSRCYQDNHYFDWRRLVGTGGQ